VDCRRFHLIASVGLDDELTPAEAEALDAHAASCPACREYEAGIWGIAAALRGAKPIRRR